MKPYETLKLTESPDVGDLQREARKSSVGHFPNKSGDFHSSVRDSSDRRKTRRSLKRSDKNQVKKIIYTEV